MCFRFMLANIFLRWQITAVWQLSLEQSGPNPMTMILEPLDGIGTCTNAFCLAIMGGVLDLTGPRHHKRTHLRPSKIKGCKCCRSFAVSCQCCRCLERRGACFPSCPTCAWQQQVADLANRTLSVQELLEFYKSLGTKIMPHFDPAKSSTNDVVRQAIIPSSWRAGEEGGRCWVRRANSKGRNDSCTMITHDWGTYSLI